MSDVELTLLLLLGGGLFVAVSLIVWSLFLNDKSVYKVEMFKIGLTFALVVLTGAVVQYALSSESFKQNRAYDQAQQELEFNQNLVLDIEALIDQRISLARLAINDYRSPQQAGGVWIRYQESAINWDTRVSTYHNKIKSFAGEAVADELHINDIATTTMHYLFTQVHNRLLGAEGMSENLASTTLEFPQYVYQNYFSSLNEADRLVDKLVEKKTKSLTELNAKLNERRADLRTSK